MIIRRTFLHTSIISNYRNKIICFKMTTQVSASAFYKQLNTQYGIDGKLDAGNLSFLKTNYQSLLYICSDIDDDKGYLNGFHDVKDHFKHAVHIPLVPTSSEYQIENTDVMKALLAYKQFEYALDNLPTPTAIACKSSNRASALYAAYKGIKERLTIEELMQYAQVQNLKFLGSPGLLSWVRLVHQELASKNPVLLRQLFDKESSTYTYLLADETTKDAIIIDPVFELVGRDSTIVTELGLHLKYVLNTHVHADHITGSGVLKQKHEGCQSILSKASQGLADILVSPYERIQFGSRSLIVVPTPGHTEGCVSYILDDLSLAFTGDALLIRGCGRTDFQGGSANTLYHSVHKELFDKLPDQCKVMPAHDYNGRPYSTILEEKKYNPRLTKSIEEFMDIMNNLNLPRPKRIDDAVPANLKCGLFE